MSETAEWYASDRDRVEPRPPLVLKPAWMRYGIHFCRDGADGLARHLRRVPERFLTVSTVQCVCGTDTVVEDVAECGCGRLFLRDGDEVWAAKLPVE